MKFCSKCGKEIHDDSIICPGCGCSVESKKEYGGLATAALYAWVNQKLRNSTPFIKDRQLSFFIK